ncbi:transmembrane 7 superfamily member 3 [Aedes aegypti]|uniref:Putative conserved plasma membrane protein n=1 Tax=Aedes aegypti TaxID=7159 RepID=A0A0P6K136_AEDAE|nr:transmembrane 7 superfamily member 3 [Aedes aegypti]
MNSFNSYRDLTVISVVLLCSAISTHAANTTSYSPNSVQPEPLWSKVISTNSVNTDGGVFDESFAEQPQFTYNVVQVTVPKHIKINDINDYREIVLPAYSNMQIQLVNMARNGNNVGFALIQVNAYEFNVTLSYTKTIIDGSHLTGLNVGLILNQDGNLYAINTNPHEDIWISLVLMLYNKTAPLPGGCNMEFPVEVSPVMNLTLLESTIEVDTPPASVARQFNESCGKAELRYESYYLSMPSYDFSQKTYFNYIRNLISYANAKASGRLNNLTTAMPSIKRIYDRQIGRGMVFVTVVIDPVHRGFAAYVPVHSYACQPFLNIGGCYEFNIPIRIVGLIITIIMAAEIIIGFCPHVVKALICGGIVGLIGTMKFVQAWNLPVTHTELVAMLVLGTITCAVLFTVIAIYCPIATILICNVIVGYMICSIIYYGFYGNLFIHLYVTLILLLCGVGLGLLLTSIPAFLLANSFLFGAVALFYGVNVVFSARLHYSLRNLYHGVYEDNYQTVLSDSTLDINEIMACASFAIILSICIYLRVRCRLRENQVVPRGFWIPCGNHGSRTSLAILADDAFTYDHPTITRWTSGDDDVFESPATNARFFDRLRKFRRQRVPT